jgi:hypothetical protein
VTTT